MSEIFESVKKTDGKTSEEREKFEVENLREKLREEKQVKREEQRDFCLRKARLMDDEEHFANLVGKDIAVLAKSLKNKSEVSYELLHSIMNTLLESEENIAAFLKVDGALQALLRLVSGQNEKFQLVAAECICNLSLGNKKQASQVLRAAESYLMVHLSGRNAYVKEVCAIALGNLSTQGVQNIELLMKQGFLPKIINLLGEDSSLEAAVYALTQLVYHGFDILRSEDLECCFLAILPVFRKNSFSVAFLISLLSSSKATHSYLISNGIHFEALNHLLVALNQNKKEAVHFLRIVSNLSTEESVGKELVERQNQTVRNSISHLLHSEKDYLQKECLSWLGNFLNSSVVDVKIFGEEVFKENFELIEIYVKNNAQSFSEEMVS